MTQKEIEFLQESNAIEDVMDEKSLDQAKIAWEYLMGEEELTTGVVLKTHKILMLNQPIQPDEKGYFRKSEVRIGHRFGLNAIVVPEFMDAWCKATMELAAVLNPIALHIAYEKIHPFIDGNGRTGRMFLNWTRLKLTGESLLIIKASEREEYYKWFQN